MQVTKRIEWCSGHRVLGHGGKCRHIHGHTYAAEVVVAARELDRLGFVIDFSVIKERVKTWIDEEWDHRLLLNSDDPQAPHLAKTEERPPFLFDGENPTAENMAKRLYGVCESVLAGFGVDVVSIRIYETPDSWADYIASGGRRDG